MHVRFFPTQARIGLLGIVSVCVVAALVGIGAAEQGAATPPAVHKIQVTSPVQYFRELLAMTPEQRERTLSRESSEKKKLLEAKVAEYLAMSREERELRLRMTQLRWYLVPLLKTPVADRAKLLERIPAEDRVLIERRLELWDKIPVQVQKEFLENELHLGYLLKWQGSSAEQRARLMESFPAGKRERMEREIAKWNGLSDERRGELATHFNQFFELNDREKAKILEALPPVSREQMENVVKSLDAIPPDQRKQYIEAYNRFAQLSPEDRRQFFKNAAKWEEMSEAERQAWRELVRRSATPPPPPPPLPPTVSPQPPIPGSSVARTNPAQ